MDATGAPPGLCTRRPRLHDGVLHSELCIIGAGSGGLSVAAGAVQLGASVVLVEKHQMCGDCLNPGCVPSKALLAAAHAAQAVRGSARFGVKARALGEGIRRNATSHLLVLWLVPLFPFFLVNLVPAFVGVRLPVYVATTALGILPGIAVFSLAGAGLGEVLAMGGALDPRAVLTPQILGALLGLAALSLAAIPLKTRFAKA
ncbi:FAD-dependent oxidoreductase [Falsiroseomonas sp.]|uniref:FAD-dependent oxidoreductase n=1 Tax=Falsiroseomonas sp. TaxID=2870721 RepID=UPI0027204F09|nr:FAD-dependent oxidoreductase [Falsiroseomonas sp.]MDO9500414.1 FAD-dependent oxidoreductase [Falsiroseomonas sp.]